MVRQQLQQEYRCIPVFLSNKVADVRGSTVASMAYFIIVIFLYKSFFFRGFSIIFMSC